MLDLQTLTYVHVLISLVAIAAGFVVLYGMIANRRLPTWTAVFLATTVLTSATGFLFPYNGFTPALGLGVLSLVILAPTLYALYVKGLAGRWWLVYVVGAVVAFYFNFFVLIVQAFRKIPALHDLAPTESEPPFAIAQGVALLAFIALGWLAASRFKGTSGR